MKSGKGKPCGASYINASKVCRVSMAPEVQKALNAVAGEVGAATLKEAVRKHAGGAGVNRLREIRADIRNEMGGKIVKGPRADELKKRLQAEGLLPTGKGKSVAPEAPVAKSLPTDLKNEIRALAAKDPQVPEKGRTTLENEDLSRIMRGESPLNMKIVSDAGELGMSVLRQKSQIGQLQSVLGLGAQTRQEVGRDLEGLQDEAKQLRLKLIQQAVAAPAGSKERKKFEEQLERVNQALAAKTAASDRTQFARESARDTDERIKKNGVTQQEGDRNYNWDSSVGSGAKKLGSGAFGTVIAEPGKGNAVKRGDVGEDEAKLIDRIGKVDLGPKLKAAELDGDTGRPGTKLGRLAMTVVPGKPIGYKKPDALVGGVKVADAYWTARANLHRMGIAHNDMHIDNVFIDNKGKGRFVDMGLAQGSPKAALAEAMGVFQPPKGSSATRAMGAAGQGDWQTRRWDGTAGKLLETYESRLKDGLMPALTEKARKELEEKAPVLAKIQQNKADVQFAMKRDGFTNDDIASVMDHGIRSPLDTYNQGAWSRISDDQARKYIDILYDGI